MDMHRILLLRNKDELKGASDSMNELYLWKDTATNRR